MHAAIQFAIFWGLAFLTLGPAVVLLGIFSSSIENDLELHSPGKEAAIAGAASLVEAAGIWLIIQIVPPEYRPRVVYALFIPAIIVAIIYKISHLESWSRYESLFLLMFQVAIGAFGASLVMGHFLAAFSILIIFVAVMATVFAFARSL